MIIRQDKEYIWVKFEKKDYGGAGRKPAEEIIALFYQHFEDENTREFVFDTTLREWRFDKTEKNLKKLEKIRWCYSED